LLTHFSFFYRLLQVLALGILLAALVVDDAAQGVTIVVRPSYRRIRIQGGAPPTTSTTTTTTTTLRTTSPTSPSTTPSPTTTSSSEEEEEGSTSSEEDGVGDENNVDLTTTVEPAEDDNDEVVETATKSFLEKLLASVVEVENDSRSETTSKSPVESTTKIRQPETVDNRLTDVEETTTTTRGVLSAGEQTQDALDDVVNENQDSSLLKTDEEDVADDAGDVQLQQGGNDATTTVVPDSLADLDNELVGPGREAKAIESSFSLGGFLDNSADDQNVDDEKSVSIR
jgi:hypothetical protein